LWWLEVTRPAELGPERLPVFMAEFNDKEIYGFPIFGQPGLKIANHRGGDPTTLETVDRTTAPGEENDVVGPARFLFGEDQITGRVVTSAVCLYTNTPDGNFIIDRHPAHSNVAIGAGFSGHGFKFTPAVGELLVALLDDPRQKPPSILSLDRFG
jgi:glycine/D-amino acid oxidase-like deaminating enzyme